MMKQTVLDVLMYLFEYYAFDDTEFTPYRDELHESLENAGFNTHVIDKAFLWLEDLADKQDNMHVSQQSSSLRVYREFECDKIPVEFQGVLLSLEQRGVLDPLQREIIIEQIMALEEDIDMEQFRWITLMVLFNQAEDDNYPMAEELLLNPQEIAWH